MVVWSIAPAQTKKAKPQPITAAHSVNTTIYAPHMVAQAKGFDVEAGIKLVSNLAANQKVVVGLAAAHNNDPDLIARSLWLALNGTNDAYVESDDGTTDVSVDSGVDLVAGTLYHVRVEVLSTSKANIYLNGRHLNPSTALKVGSGTLQPYIAVTNSTGTGTPALDVDYLAVYNAV